MRISHGNVLTQSEVTPDGNTATHRDQDSEFMYNVLKPFFMQRLSESVGKALEDKIAEKWQDYVDDPTPRWSEVVIEKPGIARITWDGSKEAARAVHDSAH
jgi:hypothetical protein